MPTYIKNFKYQSAGRLILEISISVGRLILEISSDVNETFFHKTKTRPRPLFTRPRRDQDLCSKDQDETETKTLCVEHTTETKTMTYRDETKTETKTIFDPDRDPVC